MNKILNSGSFGPFHLGYAEFEILLNSRGELERVLILNFNDLFLKLSGETALQPGDAFDLGGDEWTIRFGVYNEHLRAGNESAVVEFFFKSKNWTSTQIRKCSDGRCCALYTDITAIYDQAGSFKHQEAGYEFFLRNIQGFSFQILNNKGRISSFLAGAFEDLTGYPESKIDSIESFFSLIHPDDIDRVRECNRELYGVKNASHQIEYRIITRDGTEKWLRSYDRNVEEEDGVNVVQGILFDVSEQKQQELKLKDAYTIIKRQNEELDLLSRTDPLTKLNNRRAFVQQLKAEADRADRYAQPFSILMLDLDHFKRVNDSHGHLTGDEVLIKTADLLMNNFRRVDCIARWGGEEFIILLANTGASEAEASAQKLKRELARTSFSAPRGEAFSVTFSCGVAESLGGEGYENILVRADEALYRAKRNGRNRIELQG